MALAATQPQSGFVIDGQFELEKQLGVGGMGTVWAATDLKLGRSVAIKFLSSDFYFDEPARQRFEREARLASKIRSPHVVQVFSQGITEESVPFVVMELLDGEDLSNRITRSGPCSLVETGSIIEQVGRALSRAHQAGLVHRDIKPHNIFLVPESDGQTFVKLLDFGIAKDVSAKLKSLTMTGSMLGTVLYSSPEQLRDAQSVGLLSDVWGLGVVVYEMLTGVPPFDGETLPEVVIKIASARYLRATEVNPALPPAIDGFFERVLQPEQSLRMQSVEEVVHALGRIVRANASSVRSSQSELEQASLARSQPVSEVAVTVPQRPSASLWSRWPQALLVLLLGAGAIYYFFSMGGAAPQLAAPNVVRPDAPAVAPDSASRTEQSVHAATSPDPEQAAEVQPEPAVPSGATGPGSAKASESATPSGPLAVQPHAPAKPERPMQPPPAAQPERRVHQPPPQPARVEVPRDHPVKVLPVEPAPTPPRAKRRDFGF